MRPSPLAELALSKRFLNFLFCIAVLGGIFIALKPLLGRGQALVWLGWLIAGGFSLYLLFDIGAAPSSGENRSRTVMRMLLRARDRAGDLLFGVARTSAAEYLAALAAGVFFAALAAILFAKNKAYLDHLFDLHWHMSFLDYDLDWHTPIFSLSGNILYDFGMQMPMNTSLSPLNGLAHLVPPAYRLTVSYVLFYLAAAALLWAIGHAAGLRPVARAIFASLTALMVTVPYGLDYLVPFLPTLPFTTQAMLTRYWEEISILSLASAFLFFWLGQYRSIAANLATALAFAIACYVTILAFPAPAIFSALIIGVYCLVFLATSTCAGELLWKLGTGGALFATMLAARIPIFFKNLYTDGFGLYFFERAMNIDSRFVIWKNATIAGVFAYDPKVTIICVISLCTALCLAVWGRGGIRRIAIALVACEFAIVAYGGVIAYLHVPLSLYYADQMQAPVLAGFLVLSLLFVSAFLVARCEEIFGRLHQDAMKRGLASLTPWPRIAWSWIWWSGIALALVLILVVAVRRVPVEPDSGSSSYPPAAPPSVQILRNELAVSPGASYRGRALTLVAGDFPTHTGPDVGPLFFKILNILEDHYGHGAGNDHWNDLLYFNIPIVGEYAEYTTPLNFLFLREFFGDKDDVFNKALFVLRRYDPRVARMIGVRYVVTDESNLPGGTLVYQQMEGDKPLRLFRIDDTNLGQYSPTRLKRVATATAALTAIRDGAFDPTQDAVIEEDQPANLVPGALRSLTVEFGPALHVKAESTGTSLLVLPFEYSHCLHLEGASDGSARLLPVNLQQTGLLFTKHADVTITYRFGPLDQASCRGDDLSRIDRLQLHDAL